MDRQELETILSRRFSRAARAQLAAAANAIMALEEEWEEREARELDMIGDDIGMPRFAMLAGGMTVRMNEP